MRIFTKAFLLLLAPSLVACTAPPNRGDKEDLSDRNSDKIAQFLAQDSAEVQALMLPGEEILHTFGVGDVDFSGSVSGTRVIVTNQRVIELSMATGSQKRVKSNEVHYENLMSVEEYVQYNSVQLALNTSYGKVHFNYPEKYADKARELAKVIRTAKREHSLESAYRVSPPPAEDTVTKQAEAY